MTYLKFCKVGSKRHLEEGLALQQSYILLRILRYVPFVVVQQQSFSNPTRPYGSYSILSSD